MPYPYLTSDAWEPLESLIKQKFVPHLGEAAKEPGYLTSLTFEMFRENAYIETLELYKKLVQLKVLFAGIETESKQLRARSLKALESETGYRDIESVRIETMVNSVFINLAKLEKGGVVIVWTGNVHAHRLAANLQLRAKADNNNALELDIHSFKIVSSYVVESEDDKQYALEVTASVDSDEVKAVYKTLPCPTLKPKDYDALNNSELASLMDTVMQKHTASSSTSSQSTTFFAPSASHDLLVKELKDYLSQNSSPYIAGALKAIAEKRDYSFGLRLACASGKADLVKLVVRYSNDLVIDFNSESSNGKNALKWFADSTATDAEKKEINDLLEAKMQVLTEPKVPQSSATVTN